MSEYRVENRPFMTGPEHAVVDAREDRRVAWCYVQADAERIARALALLDAQEAEPAPPPSGVETLPLSVLEWARERLANTARIAAGKTGADRDDGWLEDQAYWREIVAALEKAPPPSGVDLDRAIALVSAQAKIAELEKRIAELEQERDKLREHNGRMLRNRYDAEIEQAIARLAAMSGRYESAGAMYGGIYRERHGWAADIAALTTALACLRDYSSLVEALKAVVKTDDDCPVCDRGRLRNPAKTHWPECPFGRAQVLLAKLEPQP